VNSKRENAAIVGVGAVACAACCAGPIIGFLGALGLLAGIALFGTIGLAAAAVVVLVIVRRRRRQSTACATPGATSVVVEITSRSAVTHEWSGPCRR
jgi:Flp pilus assembly protein TadB